MIIAKGAEPIDPPKVETTADFKLSSLYDPKFGSLSSVGVEKIVCFFLKIFIRSAITGVIDLLKDSPN